METMSLVASFVSVIIGVFAIWLSVTFYRLTSKVSEDTKEAAKGISASVDRLESLFDRLYADTFSMMRDTVSDMRKHIWPEKEPSAEVLTSIEKRADDKIEKLRDQISKDLSGVMQYIGKTDNKLHDFEDNLTKLIDKAIQQTRRVESEAHEEMSMSEVLNRILSFVTRYGETHVGRLLGHPALRQRYPKSVILESLRIMLRDGVILIDGDIDDPSSIIHLAHGSAKPQD